jgi:hypothetical protein
MVTINWLAEMLFKVAGKKLTIKHVPGPLGVRGRNSGGRRTEVPAKRGSKLQSESRRQRSEDRDQRLDDRSEKAHRRR